MKLKLGDKVRFLNESLEGEVVRILAHDRAEVVDAFGFTHITDEKLLVRVEYDPQPGETINNTSDREILESKHKIDRSRNPVSNGIITALDPDETIYAAIRLHDSKSPLTTDIDLILVNNTGFHLLFSVSRQLESLRKGIDAGSLQGREERFIGVFSQDELHRFAGFEFQFLFFSNVEYRPRPPLVKNFSFSSSDFVDTELRSRQKGYDDSILLMPLYVINTEQDLDIAKLLEKYQQSEAELKLRSDAKLKRQAAKNIGLSRHKVVDLHIEELLKDYSEMSNAQIISYQVNYFLYELDQALLNRFNKITFIHGIGQGVLKSAIREELKRYPDVRYGDAPPEKYGYGATEVELL